MDIASVKSDLQRDVRALQEQLSQVLMMVTELHHDKQGGALNMLREFAVPRNEPCADL